MADPDPTRTPRTSSFLNQWASMLNMISATSTPVSNPADPRDALDSFSDNDHPLNQPSMADFAENPPLFTCSYCPFILLDAQSLEEHERLHHVDSREHQLLGFDDSSEDPLSKQLFGGNMPSLPSSPQYDPHLETGSRQNNTSGSINLSGSINASGNQSGSGGNTSRSGRQFGRTLQQGQVQEMQMSLSNSSSSPQNISGNSIHNLSGGAINNSRAYLMAYRGNAASVNNYPSRVDENSNDSVSLSINGTAKPSQQPKPACRSRQSSLNEAVLSDDSQDAAAGGKSTKGKRNKNRKGQYVCDVCGKVFGYQQNLNQHRRMHTGEKYACTVCKKEFNFSQNLHQHMRVHSGKKEYQCPFCCKEFNDAANFHRHKRVIHGITGKGKGPEVPKNVDSNNPHPHMRQTGDDITVSMPFSCPRCAMCFVLDSSLQKHLLHCVSPSKDGGEPSERSSDAGVTNNTTAEKKTSATNKRKREPKQSEPKGTTGSKSKKVKTSVPVKASDGSSHTDLHFHTNVQQKQQQHRATPQTSSSFQSPPPTSHYAKAYTPCQQQTMHMSPAAPSHISQGSPSPPELANTTLPFTCKMTPSPDTQHMTRFPASTPSPNCSYGSPLNSPTSNPGTIFICPYCGFGVTNSLVFREHLMHHREGIQQQYKRYLEHGQITFDGIIQSIMASSVQVLNSPQESPVTSCFSRTSDSSSYAAGASSGSNHSSPNHTSPAALNGAQKSQPHLSAMLHHNTPVDGLAAGSLSYGVSPNTASQWLQQHHNSIKSGQYNPNNQQYRENSSPAHCLSNAKAVKSRKVNGIPQGMQDNMFVMKVEKPSFYHQQQVAAPPQPRAQQVSPSGGMKGEFDDSGIVEGDIMSVSPWRLMNNPGWNH